MLAGTVGIVEGVEPMFCASTGQEVRGRHANTYSIEGTNAYYRVLAKVVPAWDADPSNHAGIMSEYKASLAPATKKISLDPINAKEVK